MYETFHTVKMPSVPVSNPHISNMVVGHHRDSSYLIWDLFFANLVCQLNLF